MRGRALDDPGYEGAALIVDLSEHANSRIGHVPLREHPLEAAMLERASEDIRELVIGRILRGVEMGVGGAELRQHGVDHDRRVFARARRRRVRAETGALFLPVEAIEVGIVEAVAHQLPDLVEVRLISTWSGLVRFAGGFRVHRPRAERSRRREPGFPYVSLSLFSSAPAGWDRGMRRGPIALTAR